jgi:predicted transcriptional regulator
VSGTKAGAQKREEAGRHASIPDDELIELVAALGKTTAAELAAFAGIGHITACARLRYLYERGTLVREKRHMRFSHGRPSWMYEKSHKPCDDTGGVRP